MRIFLMAYARKNLGDDLFIKMILEKYPEHEFFMKINNKSYLENFNKYTNLRILEGNDTDEELYRTNEEEYDAYIYIGGSIFMEGGKVYNLSEKFYNFLERCNEGKKPFCYISSNYGLYYTNEYFDLTQKAFSICSDICFRDKYSYQMFKSIPTVRYAPDYIFTYKINKDKKIKNSVGVSVIDLKIRETLKNKEAEYLDMLTYNIKEYIEAGKKVYLFSFCENEGDEQTINTLLERFEYSQNIVPVRYNGNIDEFINIYSQMEYMICARFHAMILSSISNEKMYIMSYSKKIDNVIQDLDFNLPIIHFDEINSNTKIDLKDFENIENRKIKKVIKEAEKQELGINKYIV